jgi:hypothetical protein
MFTKILIGVAVVVMVFAIVIALRPSQFRIIRTATFGAPPSAAFAQVNDFHKWAAWSPWERKDPSMKRTYEGPTVGKGAVYRWVGNKEVGEGGMTIIDSRADELIRIRLDFLKPFAATNTAEFSFEPQGDQTLVTWSMAGRHNFMGKAVCMFMDMEKMVGGDFEAGLAAMKTIAESSARPAVARN